ncbi:hypothetical protein [Caldimonas sp. KR1-144]
MALSGIESGAGDYCGATSEAINLIGDGIYLCEAGGALMFK